MHLNKSILVLITLSFFVYSACNIEAGSEQNPKQEARVSEIPGIDLSPSAEIPTFDFTIDDKNSMHVVYRAVSNNTSSPSTGDAFFYVRGDAGGQNWTQPVTLAANKSGDEVVRIVAGPDGLHILFGKKLRHFVSRDGQSWRELAPLIPDNESRADVFDLVTSDDHLIVSYLFHPNPPYEAADRGSRHDQNVYVVRWSSTRADSPARIASFPASMFEPPSPRLLAEGPRLHLMCGLNQERRDANAVRVAGKLFYMTSNDRGITWSAPVDASLGSTKGATSSRTVGMQTLGGIELLSTSSHLYAFYHDTLLFMSSSADGSNWSPAVEITGNRSNAGLADFISSSVSIAGAGNQARIAWIDTRFRNSDRHSWSLLDKLPWSDDNPDWLNNDIFTLKLSDILSTANTQPQAIPAPTRLTGPLSYANLLRARASSAHLFLLWSGRSKVGKRLDSFNQPPGLFYTSLTSQ